MREVLVSSTPAAFAQDIAIGTHRLRADEPAAEGGTDTGPEPHELLLAALGSCTSMTLKVYSARKGWPLRDVRVKLTGGSADGKYVITRQISMAGDLDAEQRKRLIEIADKCPVHKTLSGTIAIQTTEGS
jgi:putative redox protein